MIQAIIVLVVIGFLMIAAEVCVPGMVLGVLGTLCLLAAVVLCYSAFGPLMGTMAFAVLAVLLIVGFFLWLRIFPHTTIGKKLTLGTTPSQGNSSPAPALLGATGQAVTPLRPAGTALINGARVDVVAESGMIEAGSPVEVIFQEGLRVVVRQAD